MDLDNGFFVIVAVAFIGGFVPIWFAFSANLTSIILAASIIVPVLIYCLFYFIANPVWWGAALVVLILQLMVSGFFTGLGLGLAKLLTHLFK